MPPLPASFALPGKKPGKKPPKPSPAFKPPKVPAKPTIVPQKVPAQPAPVQPQPAPMPQPAPIPQLGGYAPTPAAARAAQLRARLSAGLEKPQRIRRQRFARPVQFLKTARKAEHARFTQPSKATALSIKKRKQSVFFKGVWDRARVASAIALYKLSKVGRKKYSLEELLKKVKAALDKGKGITLA